MTVAKPGLRFPLAALFVFMTFAAFLACGVRSLLVQVTAEGVTPAEANRVFWEMSCNLRVPNEAEDVDVHARFQGGGAAFNIEERAFLNWAQERDWPLTRLSPLNDHKVRRYGLLPEWPNDSQDAWYFSNSTHRGGWNVLYDRKRERAYVYYAPR